MRQRNSKDRKSAKLVIKKETLRQLQLRTLSDDELVAAAGGWGDGAPSCRTRC